MEKPVTVHTEGKITLTCVDYHDDFVSPNEIMNVRYKDEVEEYVFDTRPDVDSSSGLATLRHQFRYANTLVKFKKVFAKAMLSKITKLKEDGSSKLEVASKQVNVPLYERIEQGFLSINEATLVSKVLD